MATKERIQTAKAPAAIGPYSQAIKVGGFVYTAGQVGLDPVIGKPVEGGVPEQTRQALENLRAILEAAGGSLETWSRQRCSSPTWRAFPP